MKSYLKFLSRNKLYTTVEAAGLIFSLAFVIIIGCYAWEQYEVTRENPDRERVYALGMPDWYGLTLGFRDVAAARLPEIEVITHIATGRMGYVKPSAGSKNTLVSYMYADGRFFDIFPQYEILEGSDELLEKGDHLMVSESFARAHEVQVGDLIDCIGYPCTVCGIYADFRHTLMKTVDMIVSANSSVNEGSWKFPFDGFGTYVPFVRLREGADFNVFMEKLDALCKELYPDFYGSLFFEYVTATRVDKIFFRSVADRSHFNRGDIDTLRMLILVGLLLLVSAVFNYINLNTALTARRAKEMAIRRLLGASRTGIIGKYIGESMLFTTLCFGSALLLAVAFAPVMDRLLNNPYITVRVLFSPVTVAGFAATVVIVGFLSGIIPAMLASQYKPIDVIKGSFRAANRMTFSKIFIVLQNALAVFMIAMALVMEAQYSCSLNRPKHAETDSLFYLRDLGRLSLAEALRALPCVRTVGRTIGAPGFEVSGRFSLTRDGRDILYRHFMMDSTAFSMFKFEKIRDYAAPQAGAIWFGERAFTASGFDDENHDISVLRSRIGDVGEVGGTIREFPYNASNMGEEDYLMVHVLTDGQMESEFYYDLIIATTGDKAEARDRIMETYTKWCKDMGFYSDPLYADFVDENYRRALEPARNNMRLMEIFMLLAIMISVLGLVAMSTYFAGQNAHSIAVRKVFGSTAEKETFRSVGRYMLYVGIACAVGVPVAVWAAGRYLQSFIYRLDHYGWIFVAAALLAAMIAAVSVLWQVLYSARTNPAVELKKE